MSSAFLLSIGWVLASRPYELWRSHRAARALLARGGHRVVPDGYVPIFLVHAGWIVAMLLEQALGPTELPTGLRVAAAVVFVCAEVLRFACLWALGPHWNVRVLVLPGAPPVARGPYRWLRHPNYLAATVGLVALPLALGLVWTAALVLPLKLLALRRRIRIEDEALASAAVHRRG